MAIKKINATRTYGCGVFVMSSKEEGVPRSFEMYVGKSHSIPQILIFLKIVRRYIPVVPEDKRYQLVTHQNGVYTLRLHIGFSESSLELIDIIEKILLQITSVSSMEITVYHVNENIKIISKRCRIMYQMYGGLKDMFPTSLNGISVNPENLVVLNLICQL